MWVFGHILQNYRCEAIFPVFFRGARLCLQLNTGLAEPMGDSP
jgi:hypothetical protein